MVERILDAAVERGDDSLLAAYVSGRARVTGGVRLHHPHALADLKTVPRLGCGHAHLGTRHSGRAGAAGVKAGAGPTRLSKATSRASSSSAQRSRTAARAGTTNQPT